MGIIHLGALDSGGVNKDLPSYRLAPNVFSDCLNVDFEDTGVVPSVQEQGVFSGIAGNPVHMEVVNLDRGDPILIYFTSTKAYGYIQGAFVELTNLAGMGTSTESLRWNGGYFHGYWVWTNGNGIPQTWSSARPSRPLQDLANWPDGLRVRFIRPFLNFLVGFGYTASDGGFAAQTVIWSDQADPGTLPTWDITDPAKKAGAYSLTIDSDPIEGALELRGEMFIYKQSSIWVMRYIDGAFVMAFAPRFSERGLLNSRCVVALEGSHFCLDRIGFYFHNGVEITSVGTGVVWEHFSSSFSLETVSQVFMEYEEAKNRIWIFYSSAGQLYADRVLIFDLRNKTWTFRSAQQASCATRGAMKNYGTNAPWDQFIDIWSDDPLGWGSDQTRWESGLTWDSLDPNLLWNDTATGGVQRTIHYASIVDTNQNVYNPETATTTSGGVSWFGSTQYPPLWFIPKEGVRLQGLITRLGFCFLEFDSAKGPMVDRSVYKHLTELYPEIENGVVEIRVGTQTTHLAAVDWEEWVDFDPSIDIKLDPNITEKYLAFELRGKEGVPTKWKLSGMSLTVDNAGRY